MQLLLIISIVSALTASAFGHSCYKCTSIGQNGNCADPFNAEGVTKDDCSKLISISGKNSNMCFKAVAEALGVKTYIRGCYLEDIADKKGCEKMAKESALNCEVCSGDMCNGSNMLSSMNIAVFLTVAAMSRFFF